jgi:GMP synthase-like glutamine amidotransferase
MPLITPHPVPATHLIHGGKVKPSPQPEIGWYDVDTNDRNLVPEGPWYQWHSDRWTVPPAAREIARNANASQAFLLRKNLALQFHPGLDSGLLEQWLQEVPEPELSGTIVNVARLRERTTAEQGSAAERVRRLVRGFLQCVNTFAGSRQHANDGSGQCQTAHQR